MGAFWQEPDFLAQQVLFRDVVTEAETSERVLMLFGLLRNLLTQLAQENHEPKAATARVRRIVAALNFLRESLAQKPADPFHMAFKRFYNHLHRQIIDAHRDGRSNGFAAAARSIETLISQAHANAFIGHCLEQSVWRENRLSFVLQLLFLTPPMPSEEHLKDMEEDQLIPLRPL